MAYDDQEKIVYWSHVGDTKKGIYRKELTGVGQPKIFIETGNYDLLSDKGLPY